jgi:hypothetical protein
MMGQDSCHFLPSGARECQARGNRRLAMVVGDRADHVMSTDCALLSVGKPAGVAERAAAGASQRQGAGQANGRSRQYH